MENIFHEDTNVAVKSAAAFAHPTVVAIAALFWRIGCIFGCAAGSFEHASFGASLLNASTCP
jgi:hypothetical protein